MSMKTVTKETLGMGIAPVSKALCALLLTAMALSAPPCALAQPAAGGTVAQRFPPGSIQSVETAELALGEVVRERTRIEAEYGNAEQACYPKFFATSCLDKAKEQRRASLAAIRPVEVEANAFKRRARVAERDKALAEKKAEEEAQAGQRAQQQQEQEAARAKKEAAAATPNKPGAEAPVTDRVAEHEARMKRLQQEEAADAPKRAANAAAYDKKVREAQARQQEVAAKKAEKERERAEKAAAKAASKQ
jgi:colicin import membrane protein